MKVSEALADALATEAQGPIFGLMGDANMPVWDCLSKDPRTRMVWARHDGAAVLMADGYSKATGRLGVVTVTCGPGLANCANAILTASRASTAMVIFTGEYPADGGKGGLQAMDQRQFAKACEAEFRPLAKLDSLAEDISEGFFTARTQQCPVILNMPSSLWEAEMPWAWDYQPSSRFIPQQTFAPPEEALTEVVNQLVASKRPVIIAGRGAILSDARAAIESLAESVGALLATTLIAKGLFDGHPYDIGISGSFSSAPTESLMAEADLVLGVGASMNFFTSEGGLLFPNATVARIDTKQFPAAIGAVPGLYLQGDARKTSLALLKAIKAKGVKSEGFRTATTRSVLSTHIPQPPRATDGLDPRELMRELSKSLPANAQVVSGAGHFWSWPIFHLALPPGGRFQHTAAFGSIGLGLAQGIGAAIGNPDRTTLVIEGDGSLLQGIQELHAAAQQEIPLIVLIMNDSGYGAEVLKLQWKKRNPQLAMWKSPDYVAIARGFGGDGVCIELEGELNSAIQLGMKQRGPFVIDARISPTMVSDSYSRLFLAKENQAPLLRPAKAA